MDAQGALNAAYDPVQNVLRVDRTAPGTGSAPRRDAQGLLGSVVTSGGLIKVVGKT